MKIPFELLSGIILLDVSVNGKCGKKAFDTGANTCMLEDSFEQKGFPAVNAASAVVRGGTLTAHNHKMVKCYIAHNQKLVANEHKLHFYTHYSLEKHRNDIEMDFSRIKKLKHGILIIYQMDVHFVYTFLR